VGGKVGLGYGCVWGIASDVIQPEVLADHPELAADFELLPDQTLDDRRDLGIRVRSTLQLFAKHLERLETLQSLLQLLTLGDPVARGRNVPNRALTPLYATGIAILTNSPSLPRVVQNLEKAREGWSGTGGQLGLPSGRRMWDPVVDRLLTVARSMGTAR
jgi:hypothetical protein